eukprot:GHRQ01030749.1.p1 GENE.GHRQ01030749.1~~GHRQ01030749.1.p1  ORF type:complete len:122 (-),score=36.18 GHRQ01030749.1:433-798(-)
MPSIMLFPLLPFILEVGLIIYWVAVTAVLYSAGTPTDHWRSAAQAMQPLSLKQLMLTNSSQPAPPATVKPDTTNMTRTVRDALHSMRRAGLGVKRPTAGTLVNQVHVHPLTVYSHQMFSAA